MFSVSENIHIFFKKNFNFFKKNKFFEKSIFIFVWKKNIFKKEIFFYQMKIKKSTLIFFKKIKDIFFL